MVLQIYIKHEECHYTVAGSSPKCPHLHSCYLLQLTVNCVIKEINETDHMKCFFDKLRTVHIWLHQKSSMN